MTLTKLHKDKAALLALHFMVVNGASPALLVLWLVLLLFSGQWPGLASGKDAVSWIFLGFRNFKGVNIASAVGFFHGD